MAATAAMEINLATSVRINGRIVKIVRNNARLTSRAVTPCRRPAGINSGIINSPTIGSNGGIKLRATKLPNNNGATR